MTLEEMRNAVFEKKPEFAEIVSAWGNQTLLAYYGQQFNDLMKPSSVLAEAIQEETTTILGKETGQKARRHIEHQRWTNTADHHGLLSHPYFYATALTRTHRSLRTTDDATVTLAFGGISLGNDSFPRGFMFHTPEGREERVHFKPAQERRLPVYGRPPITRIHFSHIKKCTETTAYSFPSYEKLITLYEKIERTESIWSQETYGAQLTAMNAVMWDHFFGTSRGAFVYLEIDSVVRRLFLEHHLPHKTVLHELLCNPEWVSLFLTLFSGVFGSHTDHSGTHFFWYIDEVSLSRRSLFVENDALVTAQHDVSIPLTSESIAYGLEKRILMPSTALLLIAVHGVGGLACGGGPSQLAYLPHIMRQWQTLLARVGENAQIAPVPNTEIYCGDYTFPSSTFPCPESVHPATFIDAYLYTESLGTCVDAALESTSMSHMVDGLVPTLHALYLNKHKYRMA